MTNQELKEMEDNEDRTMLKERNRKAIELRQDYRNVFLSTVEGRRVLKHLQGINYFFDPINPAEQDAIGRRNAICGIMNMLCCADDPDRTIDAINEAMLKWPVILKSKED